MIETCLQRTTMHRKKDASHTYINDEKSPHMLVTSTAFNQCLFLIKKGSQCI